jgi:hypothetical protein
MSKEQIIGGVNFPYNAAQERARQAAKLAAQSVVFPMTAEEAAQVQQVEYDPDEHDEDEYDDECDDATTPQARSAYHRHDGYN